MDTMVLYIQHAFNVDTNEVEYGELLIRKYKGIDNVIDILRYVDENNEFIDFDLEIIDRAIEFITNNNIKYRVAVNLSPNTLKFSDATDRIIDKLNNCDCKDKIVLEITEDTNLDSRKVISSIKRLVAENIIIALDDFGTSKSSLKGLVNIETNYIKIDKSFIDSLIDEDKIKRERDQIILDSIRDMAEALKASVIVEGVETLEQLEEARKLGFNCIQGYLLEKPMPLYT